MGSSLGTNVHVFPPSSTLPQRDGVYLLIVIFSLCSSKTATKIVRFVQHKWHHWATGNYLLDYEDPLRGYGGIVQSILVANQRTGFPSVIRLTAEQHSFGTSSEFEIHVKAEGLADNLKSALFNTVVRPPGEPVEVPKLLEILEKAKFNIQQNENLHLETIVKVNGQTIYCHSLNKTTFNNYAIGKPNYPYYNNITIDYSLLCSEIYI